MEERILARMHAGLGRKLDPPRSQGSVGVLDEVELLVDLGEEARERRRRATPLGTEGTGWDVGWGAVYLASDEARWVTGQTLVIDASLTVTTR